MTTFAKPNSYILIIRINNIYVSFYVCRSQYAYKSDAPFNPPIEKYIICKVSTTKAAIHF